MEYVIILLLFLIVLLARALGRHNRSQPGPKTRYEGSGKRFQPFDATSAKPLPAETVLQGYASIVDGDTIVIQKTQIRLFGIDAPELDHPYGKKAKWALVSLCKGQTVRAEITEFDNHGRTVAKCYLPDGRDLSAEMVKQGLAIDWPKFSGGKYRAFEVPDARKKLWLADARQNGRMHVWERFEARRNLRKAED